MKYLVKEALESRLESLRRGTFGMAQCKFAVSVGCG